MSLRTQIPLIVIGASAGGLDALVEVLSQVSPQIPAAILVVIHIGELNARLPEYFESRSPLPVTYAQDHAPIEPGKVYFAPPDRHLIVEEGSLRLGRGPRENHARPAIDTLFRSAAEVYGALVTGVVLTGYLTDGTAGLWEVKRRGGIAIVQDPEEAEVPAMPASAQRHVAVDYCLKLRQIGQVLNTLAAEAVKKAPQLASLGGGSDMEYTADTPAALTCATCGGALTKLTKGTYTQFRCHIGHTFGAPELAQEQLELLRSALETCARLLNERVKFFRATASETGLSEQESTAWEAAAEESEARFDELTKLLTGEWKRPELTASSFSLEPPNIGPARNARAARTAQRPTEAGSAARRPK
jgi:two-component system, chemotaxis family, protein-glutamate methylesterase/glutaminase